MFKKIKDFVFLVPTYYLLATILIGALFVRVYRTGDLLQFYYDQGRDALVIWDLWHKGKFFLIGPITGLKGIFLGPFYYYLIAPFYLIGQGNPVFPAVFLAILSTLSVLMLYILGAKMHSRKAGLLAAFIASFSYAVATFARWLSNPNTILLTSLLFLWSLWEIALKSKSKSKNSMWWILASLMVGLSLQLESASAVFYIPVFLTFGLWLILRDGLVNWRKSIPNFKILFWAGFVFFITLLPQFIFDLRHENILFNNFKNLFLEEKAFRSFTSYIFNERLKYFWNTFTNKIFPSSREYAILFTTISASAFITSFSKFRKTILPIFGIFLLTPMIGYILFQGNYGNIYDYYLSGYILPYILLFSIGMAEIWKRKFGFLFIALFLIIFVRNNLPPIRNLLISTIDTRPISLEEQLAVVDWVFKDANGRSFNVDFYVPPVIPYSYDYLFLWQGYRRCGDNLCGLVKDGQVPLLYTLYEPDTNHPDRIEAWFERQKGIGVVEEEFMYGHLTVQRRKRL